MKKTVTNKPAVVLGVTARTAIVNAVSAAYTGLGKTGALPIDAAKVAARHMTEYSKDTADAVADAVSRAQGWKGKTADSRKSEIRVLLKASHKLPEFHTACVKLGSMNWHDTMALARWINKDETQSECVSLMRDRLAGKGTPGTTVTPQGRALSAMLSLYKETKGERRDAVRKALRMLRDARVFNVSAAQAEKAGL